LVQKVKGTVVPEKAIDKVIAQHRGRPGELLNILEEAQNLNPHKFLPRSTLEYIAKKLKLPASHIYSVVTFYAFFNLKPQGDHTLVVCRGTACHTRGSRKLLDSLKNLLGFDEQEGEDGGKVFLTTKDNAFTIKTVACFGQCALAPVVEMDGNVYGYMTPERLKTMVSTILKNKKRK
jgi:NADH-quinone oxidoreductase subunit E